MIRSFNYKLYPNQTQVKTLERWLGVCCWTYNRMLEGRIKAKKLSERSHSCGCGLTCDRDVASASVILSRAVVVSAAKRALTDSTSDLQLVAAGQADRLTCVNKHAPLVSHVC